VVRVVGFGLVAVAAQGDLELALAFL